MSVRARSIGEILDGAFRLYRQDVGLYVFTAIIATLPMTLMIVLSFTGGESTGAAIAVLVLLPFALVGPVAVWTALVHQMNERLEGREPSLGPSFGRALRLFLRVAWGAVLAYVLLVGVMMLAAVVFGLGAGFGSAVLGQTAAMVLASVIGIGAAVLLSVLVLAGVVLFLPIVVVEGIPAYASIKRGFSLAKGGRLRIMAVFFLSSVLIFVPMMAVYFLTGTAEMFIDPDAITNGSVSVGQLATQQVLILFASGLTTPFLVACLLLLYYDQRVRREAFDVEAEAAAIIG